MNFFVTFRSITTLCRRSLAVTAMLAVFASHALAVVTLNANMFDEVNIAGTPDTIFGDYTDGSFWSDGLPAHSGDDYDQAGFFLASPAGPGNIAFPGDSLESDAKFRVLGDRGGSLTLPAVTFASGGLTPALQYKPQTTTNAGQSYSVSASSFAVNTNTNVSVGDFYNPATTGGEATLELSGVFTSNASNRRLQLRGNTPVSAGVGNYSTIKFVEGTDLSGFTGLLRFEVFSGESIGARLDFDVPVPQATFRLQFRDLLDAVPDTDPNNGVDAKLILDENIALGSLQFAGNAATSTLALGVSSRNLEDGIYTYADLASVNLTNPQNGNVTHSGINVQGFFESGGGTLFVGQDLPTSLTGDFDGDGFVGLADLNILGGAWNTNVAPYSPGDADGDGFVGLPDLNILGANWNPPPAVAVPEPTALVLASMSLLAVSRRRAA